jgi:hypothetical protein
LLRVGGTGLVEHRGERPQLRGHLQGPVGSGHECTEHGVQRERHRACDRLDEHQGHRVDIGPAVEGNPFELLGRGVTSGTNHCPGRLGPARLGKRPCQAEVSDAGAALFVKKEVRRLDVSVYQAPGVRIGQGGRDVEAQGSGLRDAEPVTAIEQRA